MSMSGKLKKLILDHPEWTQQRLADELGTSQFNVHRLIYKNNIEYRDKTIKRYSESELIAEIRNLIKLNPNWNQNQIGSELGIPQSRVSFIIRHHIPEYVKKYKGHVNKHS
ncbi:hypothetical protein AR691_14185 [Bacillus amyloliquefaciens]|nr:hypothetical protein AR691_14185 [Bacillus amyloliquefaciens]